MIDFKEKYRNSSRFNNFFKLYEASFPVEERRPSAEVKKIACSDPRFHMLEAWEGDNFKGFFTYWDFGAFTYGEHFAVVEEFRGHGIGSEILKHVIETVGQDLIIEVEPPVTVSAQRRIGFYERHGLKPWNDVNYTQPAYSAGLPSVPMMLMTMGFNDAAQVERAAQVIRREVYGAAP